MAYAAQVRKADDVVVGLWSGGATLPSPPAESTVYVFELTEGQHATLSADKLNWGGDSTRPRWKIVTGTLTEQADTRRLVVFTPATVAEVYQASTVESVTVQVMQVAPNEHLVDTAINGAFNVRVQAQGPAASNLWLRVDIASGEGTILIDREIIKEARISDQGVFRVDTPLVVRVLAPNRF